MPLLSSSTHVIFIKILFLSLLNNRFFFLFLTILKTFFLPFFHYHPLLFGLLYKEIKILFYIKKDD